MTLQSDLLRCPNCGAALQQQTCTGCGIEFSERLGILDMRWPRPLANDPAEEAIIGRLLPAFAHSTFAELVQLRFHNSRTQAEFLEIHTNYYRTLEARGRQMMAMFAQRLNDHYQLPGTHVALDLGCGTGAGMVALFEQFDYVIGIEPSLITLILARKFFEERGIHNVLLIQAYGQHIPLRTDCVDYAVAQNVIEHLLDIHAAFAELNRILKPGGCFCGDSRNRFDILFPEPHTNLHWVGFWPYKWQPWYVHHRKGLPYKGTRLLSRRELHRTARRTFGPSTRVLFTLASAYGQGHKWDRYIRLVEKIPLLNRLVLLFYPSHLLVAQAQ